MKIDQNIIKQLCRLWDNISMRRRRQMLMLLVLMFFSTLAEILSIGAVLPFLGVLTAPEHIFELSVAQPFIRSLNLTEPKQLLLPLTIAFAIAALIAGAMRLLMIWASSRISFAVGADLSISIYRRTLYQPYATHCSRNSSEVINGVSGKVDVIIYSIIVPGLAFISSSIMLIGILITLMVLDPIAALLAFSGFGLIYAVIIRLIRNRLLINSQINARESTQVVKSLQEGLGGIRDILIDGSQDIYCQIYRSADLSLRRSQGNSMFISSSPRYGMEALGMILIAMLAYSLAQQADGIAKAIPILGALALGAQRFLPMLQQVYASWTTILGSQASLENVLALLEQPLPEYANQPAPQPLPFNNQISIKNLDFRYSLQAPYVLKNISLTIDKGSCVGFVGSTGSGKSTLLDIVMGLLQPTDGVIEVDGKIITPSNNRNWQTHIAHVPQAIFLADSTIQENIAFGIPKNQIDLERVRMSAKKAKIAECIEGWPMQYQTLVGERGVRLSGGQRQRIGIARALYKQADIIIFDEATSALDNETEQEVMDAIDDLSGEITLLIIAHRLTTLKNCTQIVELSSGTIKRVGTYAEIVGNSF